VGTGFAVDTSRNKKAVPASTPGTKARKSARLALDGCIINCSGMRWGYRVMIEMKSGSCREDIVPKGARISKCQRPTDREVDGGSDQARALAGASLCIELRR
jgi:hypothetical protein